ncbi:hypothetical protein J7J90_01130, partial [Candidatus Micrarchaeota archaeon]|nr:hypothetical protein [Candidatus Micrarchaeota archaeon]
NFNELLLFTNIHENSLRVELSRYVKNKQLFRIEKGKYTTMHDPLSVASYITSPSFISCLAGLFIHHVTTQIPRSIDIITPRRHRNIQFENATFIFHTVKPKYMFGFSKVRYGKHDIFVGDIERCLVDMKKYGYPPYLIKETVNETNINKTKIQSYSKKLLNEKWVVW